MAIFIKEKTIDRISSYLREHQRRSVLDHLRESITNLKIQRNARAYSAIVDKNGQGDFKNIQDAIDYVHDLGGGSILLLPGTYTLTDDLISYSNITLEGRTPQDTIISFATANKSVLIKGSDLYNAGTITINSGATEVVGVGTAWLANLTTGHHILLGGSNWFEITAVTDDTHITIANKYFGKAQSGDTYKAAIIKNNVELRNLSVILSGGIGIDVQYANNFKIFNVFSLYHVGDALKLDVTNWNILDYFIAGHNGGKGVYINEMYNSSCDRFFIFNNTGTGLEFEGGSENNSFDFLKAYNNAIGLEINASSSNTFHRVDAKYNTAEGILISGANNTSFDATIDSNGADGIKLEGNSDNILITKCLIKENGAYGINISAATCDNTILGNNQYSGNVSGTVSDSGTDTINGDSHQLKRYAFADLPGTIKNTGFKSPSATGETLNNWTDPANAYLSNNQYASEATYQEYQDYYNFTFNIPINSIIKGLELAGEGKKVGATNVIIIAEASWDGGITWVTAGGKTYDSESDVTKTWGGSTSLWGARGWASSEFSNAKFRLKVGLEESGAVINMDHLQMKIYYTIAGAITGSVVYITDGRKAGEGAGSGTGVLAFYDGSNWIACDTGATVAA